MSAAAWAALAVAGLIAALNWVAVARGVRRLEYVTKPGVMLALIALAVVIHPVNAIERSFFVVALALGLVSDVFLMLPQDLFLFGLAAALLEHLAYIAGFRTRELHVAYLLGAAAIALCSVGVVLPAIYRALNRDHPQLLAPVILYVAVIAAMVASAGGTGSPIALAGAVLFFCSDAVLAWNRFVTPIPLGRVVNIVPYHVGQALLVLSLAS